jgi:hypothetical protein
MIDTNIYVPIGFQCTTAEILKKKGKRTCSFPFDWIISNPEAIVNLLTILLKSDCDIKLFVKNEFFKIDGLLHFLKQEEFVTSPTGKILFNSKYNLVFPHFNYSNELIEKFIKRFERLRNYILYSSNNINFVFINRLVNNNNKNTVKFSINNTIIKLNIKDNFKTLNDLLLLYIPYERFKIIIINAVENIKDPLVFDKNIRYIELVPTNNSNLTDNEIMKITI